MTPASIPTTRGRSTCRSFWSNACARTEATASRPGNPGSTSAEHVVETDENLAGDRLLGARHFGADTEARSKTLGSLEKLDVAIAAVLGIRLREVLERGQMIHDLFESRIVLQEAHGPGLARFAF